MTEWLFEFFKKHPEVRMSVRYEFDAIVIKMTRWNREKTVMVNLDSLRWLRLEPDDSIKRTLTEMYAELRAI